MKRQVAYARGPLGRLVFFGLGVVAGVLASGVVLGSGGQAEPPSAAAQAGKQQYYRVEITAMRNIGALITRPSF